MSYSRSPAGEEVRCNSEAPRGPDYRPFFNVHHHQAGPKFR